MGLYCQSMLLKSHKLMKALRSVLGLAMMLPLVSCGTVESYGNQVKVELQNESGKAISQVKVIERSGGEAPENLAVLVVTEDLAPSKEALLKLDGFVSEGSYMLEVTFDDGTVLAGGGGYVEPGYRMEETILADKIETEYKY